MTARVLALGPRPRRRPASRSRSARPSSAVLPVVVEWDGVRSLHVARCQRCPESCAPPRLGAVEDWADTHRCDPELAGLLADLAPGRAA